MKAREMPEALYRVLLRHPGRVIAAGFLLFAIKRTVNLWIDGYLLWLASDYAARLILIALSWAYVEKWIAEERKNSILLTSLCVLLIVVFLPLTLVAQASFILLWPDLNDPWEIWRQPFIASREVLLFDITVGLILVAVSEELFFRRVLHHSLRARGLSGIAAVLVGALGFGLVHITSGLLDVVLAFGYGLIFSALFLFSRRIWPGAACHYAVNFFAAALADMNVPA